jgi:ribonuclease P protein component
MKATFPKKEHLCGEIRINKLFSEGKAFISYPVRVVYKQEERAIDMAPVMVMFSVPKRKFKRAVKRNRLKRLMREAYRLNKHIIVEKCLEKNIQIQIAFNYVAADELEFSDIEPKIIQALIKIAEKLS